MHSSGNHFYSMCCSCCYEWLCAISVTVAFTLSPHILSSPFPCPAWLHREYPVVITVRQIDSASHSPGDIISIDNYLKLIWLMPLSYAALLSQILAGLQVMITDYASTVLVWVMMLSMQLFLFHRWERYYYLEMQCSQLLILSTHQRGQGWWHHCKAWRQGVLCCQKRKIHR